MQPAVGYKTRHFETALAPKISYIYWKLKKNSVTNMDNEYIKDQLAIIDKKSGFLAFEPAVLLRAGAENFKMQATLSFSSPKTKSSYSIGELVENVNASIGVSINIKPKRQ